MNWPNSAGYCCNLETKKDCTVSVRTAYEHREDVLELPKQSVTLLARDWAFVVRHSAAAAMKQKARYSVDKGST